MPAVPSKRWSCSTLQDGIAVVQSEAVQHSLDEEARKLLEEIQAGPFGNYMFT